MIDFIHQNEEQDKGVEAKPQPTSLVSDQEKKSWLRSLLHPVNGQKGSGVAVDLLKDIRSASQPSLSVDNNKNIPLPKPMESVIKSKIKPELRSIKKLELPEAKKHLFDVNLLPATINFSSTKKIITLLIVYVLLTIGVIIVVQLGISLYGQQITEEGLMLETEIDILDKETSKFNTTLQSATTWQLKLTAVDGLLRSHIYWSQFFDALEQVTLPRVYYKGFTGSVINTDMNLASFADSFAGVAKQLIAYEKFPEVFLDFSVSEASLNKGVGISYNALINLRKSIFYDEEFIKTSDE